MIRGLYSAAGGMQANSLQQDASAHNLSHAMKPGYRREVICFDSIGDREEIIAPRGSLHTDFTQGTMEHTGSQLDVALDGPGFFSVEGPNGPLYTRNGVFQISTRGQLVTPDGLPVQGIGGGVAIPLDVQSLEIQPNGAVLADGNQIGQLRVTGFMNPSELQRAGSSYFQASPGQETTAIATDVRQGYREIGNTTVVQEMVQMISGSRLFEATQRALLQISETISLNTRPR
ncbi:flagellar hook-basal body protein [Schlesneria paludicola]|uniref:flagellar hook-basal body protein n=1 Tax=Schlesneria paludicola TaxID=360056 RepID=UPI00029B336F|nr:flagellar hook basal-body protein [Schlesneria paludicola]